MGKEPQNKIVMVILALVPLTAYWGIAPLMMGHKNWWYRIAAGFLTCGVAAIWWGGYDAYMIWTGQMKMANGKELK